MSKHRILVTGSTGMLGATLVPYLRSQGHDVLAHGMSKSADINFDLSNYDETENRLENQKFSFAVNLVALAAVDDCNKDIDRAYQLNAKSAGNISQICFKKDAFLIHVSTDHLYDGDGPHLEEDIKFRNVYALSKYVGELECRFGPTAILRTNFFGKSRNNKKSASDQVVDWLRNSKEQKVFNDVFFSPLSMTTLAKCIGHVVALPKVGVFNVGSKEGFSRADFAFKFGEILKLSTSKLQPVSVDEMAQLVPRPKDMRMNVSKFEKTFAIKLPTLYEEIVSQGEEYVRI